MKIIAYLLAIICVIVAVMYYTVQAGSLPTFMPGYAEGSTHIHHLHAYAAARRRRRAVRGRLVFRAALILRQEMARLPERAAMMRRAACAAPVRRTAPR